MTYDKGCIPHDDRIDALAIGCQYIADMVVVNAESRLQEMKDKEMEDWLYDKVYNTQRVVSTYKFGY